MDVPFPGINRSADVVLSPRRVQPAYSGYGVPMSFTIRQKVNVDEKIVNNYFSPASSSRSSPGTWHDSRTIRPAT